jgi:hypothetical protein
MTTVELPVTPADEHADQHGADQRPAYRATLRAFRPRRAIPATIVAALLAAAALLTAAEVISRLLDRQLGALPVSWLSRLGRETQWQDPLALIVAGLAAVAGLLLLVLALRPGRARVVPVTSGYGDALTAASYGAVARHTEAAAGGVDGIAGARATVRKDRLRLRVDSPLRDPRGLTEQVQQAVAGRLDQLAPLRPLRLKVAVRHRRDGS